jgi:plastocyanin
VRTFVAVSSLLGVCLLAACGPSSNPGGPSATGTVIVHAVGQRGAMSFAPNPATVPDGQAIVFHNVDSDPHRIVLDDGSYDSGVLEPGTFSRPMVIGRVGAYHCTIHPSMVGAVARAK